MDCVIGNPCALHSYRVLHRLLEGELRVQSFEDGVVLATLLSLTVLASRIVTTRKGILYAVAEEVAITSYTSSIVGVCTFSSISFHRFGYCFNRLSAPLRPCF